MKTKKVLIELPQNIIDEIVKEAKVEKRALKAQVEIVLIKMYSQNNSKTLKDLCNQ